MALTSRRYVSQAANSLPTLIARPERFSRNTLRLRLTAIRTILNADQTAKQ
jgi:hypothetical protein